MDSESFFPDLENGIRLCLAPEIGVMLCIQPIPGNYKESGNLPGGSLDVRALQACDHTSKMSVRVNVACVAGTVLVRMGTTQGTQHSSTAYDRLQEARSGSEAWFFLV
ncbi:hypothetical protein Tco_0108815 [Tanacetum coccineum]